MGMLLARHRAERKVEDPDNRATRAPRRRRKTQDQPPAPVSPYAELTDEQLDEAYATNVPDGTAPDRDAKVAELTALDAENDQPDNG